MDEQQKPDDAQTSTGLTNIYAEPALLAVREALRGNGVKAEQVTIQKFSGEVAEFETTISLSLRTRTIEKVIPGKKSGGEKVEGPQGVRDGLERERRKILTTPDIIFRIKSMVVERKDKGFSTRNEIMKLPFLSKEFIYFHPCKNCNAQGEIRCQRCHGKGFESCPKCNGQGMEHCSQCRGAQVISGPQNRPMSCPTCNGQGRTPCRTCHQTRRIVCPICKKTGATKCQQCNGNAWNSYVTSAEFDVACTSNFNRGGLNDKIIQLIEKLGKKLSDYAEFTVQNQNNEQQEEIILNYNVRFPYAETELKIGRSETVPIILLGQQAQIHSVPNFLETMLRPGIKTLQYAAQGKGNVAKKIQQAGRYRTIRQAIVGAAKYSRGKAAKLLAKNTPLGMSQDAIKSLIINADKALQKITEKPRMKGMLAGSAAAGILFAIYFITPLRSLITSMLPNSLLHPAIDVLVLGIGWIIAITAIQFSGAEAMKKALQGLLPEGQSIPKPKAGSQGIWAALLCAIFFLIATEATIHISTTPPEWYAFIRNLLSK